MSETVSPQLDRVVQIGRLLDYYGELLTERQREFIRLHYAEDMSYGEIGRFSDVSRQAVHDAVRHGVNAMNNYEAKLGLVAGENAPQLGREQLTEVRQRLTELREWVRRQGVVYNTTSLQAKLKSVIDLLEDGGPGEQRAGADNAGADSAKQEG